MKKIKILIVIFLCSGCLSNPPQKGLYLDVAEQLYGKESSFCLSEICDSISYIPLETHPDALLRGLNMGIKKINVKVGDLFDEKIMNAVDTEKTSSVKPNCVSKIVRDGYYLHDRVLIHVDVVVSK